MTDDLVQQLFAEADNFKVDREVGVRGMLYRAADRIEAQAAEIERLKNKLSVETEPSPYCPICGSCGDEGCCGSKRCMYPDTGIEALEAENKRLREHLISALDTLKDAEVCDDNCGPCNEARAALEQGK